MFVFVWGVFWGKEAVLYEGGLCVCVLLLVVVGY